MFQKIVFCSFLLLVFCQNSKQSNIQKKNYKNNHQEAKTYYFLIDLSIHSGKNRFFIVDLSTQKTTDQNLVTHGSCDVFGDNPKKWEKAKTSNRINSHCSMIGKYSVGNRDYSSWGINIKYWLHGLESSNNNAEKRVVVLHSWNAVKNEEIYPRYSPLSWGCPAVSDQFMTKLDTKLKNKKQNFLLWIIN
jgi:hypothetical protein